MIVLISLLPCAVHKKVILYETIEPRQRRRVFVFAFALFLLGGNIEDRSRD